jgi:hypothetical protein
VVLVGALVEALGGVGVDIFLLEVREVSGRCFGLC